MFVFQGLNYFLFVWAGILEPHRLRVKFDALFDLLIHRLVHLVKNLLIGQILLGLARRHLI